MYQLITLGAACAVILPILFFTKSGSEARVRVIKILTLVFCAVGFFRQWLADSIYLVINGGYFEGALYNAQDTLQMIIRWGYFISYSVIPMAAFLKTRLFKNLAGYIALPFAILSTVFFDDFMVYFTDPRAHGFMLEYGWRAAYFIIELALAIALPILIHINEKHIFRFKSVSEWVNFFVGAIFCVVVCMPSYVPQAFIGYAQLMPDMFSNYHIIWIAVILVVCVGLYYGFRFRSYEVRYALCLFLAIALFFHYNSLYLMGFTLKRLPFQFCNIAAYFFLIATVFKLTKFFHFCFLANTVGTRIAIIGPDFGYGNTSFWNVHFLYEHAFVLIIPALLAGLRIFPRVTPKSIKHMAVGFTIYFMFCFILGTILNGYSDITGELVNYFYMFDLEIAFDYFPFLTFTGDYSFDIGRFTVYPLVVAFTYLGFFLLCMLYYLFVRLLYKFEDDHLALRASGIDLYEKITGKTSRRPKQYID